MIQKDAARILGLDGDITPEAVKAAFRAQAKKYHPDHNPAGLEMMKAINEAFDTLKDFTGNLDGTGGGHEDGQSYPEALNDALNAIIDLPGLEIEICGSWIWVGGETRTHKDTLKAAGFKYAPKKQKWNFRPADWKSKSRGNFTMNEIRDTYGSTRPGWTGPRRLKGAA